MSVALGVRLVMYESRGEAGNSGRLCRYNEWWGRFRSFPCRVHMGPRLLVGEVTDEDVGGDAHMAKD